MKENGAIELKGDGVHFHRAYQNYARAKHLLHGLGYFVFIREPGYFEVKHLSDKTYEIRTPGELLAFAVGASAQKAHSSDEG